MWGWTRLQPDIANVPHASLTLADVQPLWDAMVQLRDSMSVLISRTWTWLTSFLSANPVFDPIGTSLVWGFIMWLLAFWAGWAVARRKQPLLAIVPACVVLLAVMSYAGEPPSILFPLMGSSFLLMAMEKQHGRELRWDFTHVDFSRDLWTDTLMFASVLTFVLLSVSAITPAISAQKIVDFVDKLTPARSGEGEAVAGSFGVQQAPPVERKVPTSIDRMRMTGLPRSHLIGSGPELSQEVVMIVRTRELPAVPDESLLPSLPVNYYWRSLVYDVYTGRGWRTSDTNDKEYEAGDLVYGMPESIPPYQRYLRQEVQAVDELGGLIHIAGSLVAIDEVYKVSWRTQRDMFGGVVSLPSYYATSLVTEIGADELRLVQPTYPFWVQQRYLQLPDDLPARVSELAHDLTVTELTLYDRAVAIERYLRQYPYTLDVEYPPSNRDMVDYFLFDLQKGYCDYYATAMV
ncbi:MAG: transglutaminase domain-containing protein, partial [Anaerolineae bacterium]|nr:transglutaminase domain-containing protein [Anaerolineae bacterium]